MENINMQCKSISQICTYIEVRICFMLIHRRSTDTNFVEIHAEVRELLDKQVYVLNECFK